MSNANAPTPIPAIETTPRFPVLLRGVVFLVSLVVALSAVAGVVVALRQGPQILVGFEVVVFLAAFFAMLTGLGKFGHAPAMGLFIAGGSIMVGAMLGEPSLVLTLMGNRPAVVGNHIDLLPFAFARLAVGLGYFGLGALLVLIQRPAKSFRLLAVGVVLGVPVVAAGAALMNAGIRSSLGSLNGIVLAGVIVIVLIVLLGLVSASGHAIVRAFEAGLPESADEPAA